MDFEKEKKAMWGKWERHYRTLFPQKLRDIIESDLEHIDDEEYLADLDGHIEDFMNKVAYLHPSLKNNDRDALKSDPVKRYRKCFERRFYLLGFVMSKKGRISARANWKQITSEWNKANPSDTMNLPVLKTEYYRAKKDEAVAKNWIRVQLVPLVAALQVTSEKFRKIDWSILEKHGIKNLNDMVYLEDMGMTLDDLLKAQEEGQLSEYIKDIIEKRGYKKGGTI